jgi:hypothetical protein
MRNSLCLFEPCQRRNDKGRRCVEFPIHDIGMAVDFAVPETRAASAAAALIRRLRLFSGKMMLPHATTAPLPVRRRARGLRE